jgi:hypothetical protein
MKEFEGCALIDTLAIRRSGATSPVNMEAPESTGKRRASAEIAEADFVVAWELVRKSLVIRMAIRVNIYVPTDGTNLDRLLPIY